MTAAVPVLLALWGALDAPVTHVTVYSDQARVTRTAQVSLSGVQKLELPPLLDAVDASSIRVEVSGGEVRKVDIFPLDDAELPVGEARRLLDELGALDDQLAAAKGERAAVQQTLANLKKLQPVAPPEELLRAPPKLNAGGWSAALSFATGQAAKLQAKERELDERLGTLQQQRQVLAEKAQLLGGAARRRGWKVSPTVVGSGPTRVQLSYRVGRARWFPVYDLALDPGTNQVQVSFGGLVSQETGEDWENAALTLSTAVPATATVAPKLLAWKIGERDRFVPTPQPMPEYIAAPPPASPLPKPVAEGEVLRARLFAKVSGSVSGVEYESAVRAEAPPPAPPPMPGRMRKEAPQKKTMRGAPSAPPPAAMAEPEESMAETQIITNLSLGGLEVSGELAPQMSLAPPRAYQRPSYGPELPVSLAGGYDLVYDSLRKETIASGKGARKVALFSERWPVAVERKVFPALASEAFLVAELKSPSKNPLPGGNANLFVGADPAGSARLKLVSPGEAFTLPLGLDRALKPVRNVRQVTAEKGVIGKDDVTEYVVTIELANPYSQSVPVRIIDQWPVTDDKDVEVKLLQTKPYAIQDPVKGSLEWRIHLPPSKKSTVSFTYSIRRPKGWRMHQ
ncbi:MAG: DUF4139 domain-containing protein [Myxococcota bacterium]